MKNPVAIIGLVIVLLLVGFFAFNTYIYKEKQSDDSAIIVPYQGTLTGEYVCLPHADQTGPQTLECALGMKTEVGEYYALDFNAMADGVPDLRTGERFTATGLITPIEMLSSEHMRKYDAEGVISVESSEKIK